MSDLCRDEMVRDAIADADRALAWAGADLDRIEQRWSDEGENRTLLALTGQTRIPVDLEFRVLELLRRARSDVQHLLRLIDIARGADA